MLVTMRSQLTGRVHAREINVDAFALYAYMTGEDLRPVQVVFPHLSADDREFLLTGATPDEWDEIFGEEHDVTH